MSHGIISGLLTGALIIMFLGIWAWAWSKKNKTAFDQMASLPLEDELHDALNQGEPRQ